MPQLVTQGPRNNLEFLSGAAGKAWKNSSVATAVVHYYEGKQEALFNRIIAHGTFYTLRKCRLICCYFGLKKNLKKMMLLRRYQIPCLCVKTRLWGWEMKGEKANTVFVMCWKWFRPHGAPESFSRTYKGPFSIFWESLPGSSFLMWIRTMHPG